MELKSYGVIFTCRSSRAIHTEIAHSLDADSFLLSLGRFIGKRGNIRQMRSNDGSNFVGAVKELWKCQQDINIRKKQVLADCTEQIGLRGLITHRQQVIWLEPGRGRSRLSEVYSTPFSKHMGNV